MSYSHMISYKYLKTALNVARKRQNGPATSYDINEVYRNSPITADQIKVQVDHINMSIAPFL